VDSWGQLYIADRGNNRIRRVDSAGLIVTIVGSGQKAFLGDSGSAALASLAGPVGLHVDPTGMLTLADTENHRIRQVQPRQRTIRLTRTNQSILADGIESSSLTAEIIDLGDPGSETDPQVAFQIVSGEGDLSESLVVTSGGSAGTRLSSRWPGQIAVQASVSGAWAASATIEVMPVKRLSISLDLPKISANGFDRSVFEISVSDLDGNALSNDNDSRIQFQITDGAGELLVREATVINGKASTELIGLSSSRVIVRAMTEGAFPVDAVVAVTRPLPWQLPDSFEPDDQDSKPMS
jgi:hypothetical protein